MCNRNGCAFMTMMTTNRKKIAKQKRHARLNKLRKKRGFMKKELRSCVNLKTKN